MNWVRGLIKNYGIPVDALDRYIETYQDAVHEVMGDDGKIVLEYFNELSSVAA
jgi:hypothetical protein